MVRLVLKVYRRDNGLERQDFQAVVNDHQYMEYKIFFNFMNNTPKFARF